MRYGVCPPVRAGWGPTGVGGRTAEGMLRTLARETIVNCQDLSRWTYAPAAERKKTTPIPQAKIAGM